MNFKNTIEKIKNAKNDLYIERQAWEKEITKRFLNFIPEGLKEKAEKYAKTGFFGSYIVDDDEIDWNTITEEELEEQTNACVESFLIDFYNEQKERDPRERKTIRL